MRTFFIYIKDRNNKNRYQETIILKNEMERKEFINVLIIYPALGKIKIQCTDKGLAWVKLNKDISRCKEAA